MCVLCIYVIRLEKTNLILEINVQYQREMRDKKMEKLGFSHPWWINAISSRYREFFYFFLSESFFYLFQCQSETLF